LLRLFFRIFHFNILTPNHTHACKHLGKMTQSAKSVTWQTSSEYRRLVVPSGRALFYAPFVQKIQIPEIFGFPLVHAAPI
jgi:hypothetical protein